MSVKYIVLATDKPAAKRRIKLRTEFEQRLLFEGNEL